MAEPIPITRRRRYTKKQKLTVAIAAMGSSIAAAAEAEGIPRTTVAYWMDDPEIVALRLKTREQRAEMAEALSSLAAGEIRRRIGEFEPRDLVILYGVMIDKGQLMGGQATSRMETRDLTGMLDEAESLLLADQIDAWLAESKK